MTAQLSAYLETRRQLVEQALSASLNDECIPASLAKAMRYSLEAGGKRLRSILAFAGAEAVGGEAQQVMPLAIALEMIHTFSLIHDDLPAMDDDDLRRSRPTNHKMFGEATAILAGDALFAEAFYVLAQPAEGVDARVQVEVLRDVADASGARGMTGGQQIDMDATGKNLTEQELARVHQHKTGKLLTVPAVAAAKWCGATASQVQALTTYGAALGLAFQIADDILDIEGDPHSIGKPVGSDIDNCKATYPAVLGMEGARRRAHELVDRAISAVTQFDHRADPLRWIAQYVIERRQ